MSLQELTYPSEVMQELHERLRSLDANCLSGLESGLRAMTEGDFTLRAQPVTAPIELAADDPCERALVDLFNLMLQRSQAALRAYETLRVELARALGDHSCLPELIEALQSLNDHCLSDLDRGLQGMADGDLTRRASPVTKPLVAAPEDDLGQLGDMFNQMLARSRTALRSYDAVREDLRLALGDQSCLDELRTGLQSLQRHCLRDLEEALEAAVEGTDLTRPIAPATEPIVCAPGAEPGELAGIFNRALARARRAVEQMAAWRAEAAMRG